MSAQHVPAELLDPVIAYFRPRPVVLFGSAARGEAGPDSDIDLVVILDDDAPPEKLTLAADSNPWPQEGCMSMYNQHHPRGPVAALR